MHHIMKYAYLYFAVLGMCLSFGSLFKAWTSDSSSLEVNVLVFEQRIDYYLDGFCYECHAIPLYANDCMFPVDNNGKMCAKNDGVTSVYLFLVLELLLLVIAVMLNLNGDSIAGKNQTVRKYLFALPTTLAVMLGAFAMVTWNSHTKIVLFTPNPHGEPISGPYYTHAFYTGYILQIVSTCCCAVSILLFFCYGITRPATKEQADGSAFVRVNDIHVVNGHANPSLQIKLLPGDSRA